MHNHLLYGLARHLRGGTTRRFLKLFASREDLTGSFWILQPLQDAGALPLLLYWQTLDTEEQSQRDALERVIVRLEERGLRMAVDAACCRPTRECLRAWVGRSSGPVFTSIGSQKETRAWLEEPLAVTVEPTIAFLDDLSRMAEVSWPEHTAERWEHLYGCWRRVDDAPAEIR